VIDPTDILKIINDLAKRNESTNKMATVYEKLTAGMDALPPDIQKEAMQIIAGQKKLEIKLFEKDIKDFITNATGRISMQEIAGWFDVRGEEKKRIGTIVRQMEADGEIVSVGDKHGVFRLVDKNPHIMDLTAPEEPECSIELPFGLHNLVTLYQKNIILVSGEKDAGKTAFAMNVAWMNRDKMPVSYFNSEMGLEELRGRLRKFPPDYTQEEWQKITWMEQARHFEDFINPDGLNIIDFLEVGAEAFTVTDDIRRVFDKLDKGLLLIVMQKRSYKEYAVGGEGTLEKARLAVNLEHGPEGNLARITVAKNWKGSVRMKGKVCRYNVIEGGIIRFARGEFWKDPDTQAEASPVKQKAFEAVKKTKNEKEDPQFVKE